MPGKDKFVLDPTSGEKAYQVLTSGIVTHQEILGVN